MYRLCKRRRTLAPNTCSTTVGDDVTGANAMLRDSIDSIDAGGYGEGFRSINELMRSRANAWVSPSTAANSLSNSAVIDDTVYGQGIMRVNALLRARAGVGASRVYSEKELDVSGTVDDTAYGESIMRVNELLRSRASSRGNHGNAEHLMDNSEAVDDTLIVKALNAKMICCILSIVGIFHTLTCWVK